MELLTILEADGVYDDIRVEIVGIVVCGDDALVIGEQPFGKLTGYFVGLPGRDVFFILEGMKWRKHTLSVFLKDCFVAIISR